jgi:hypothetical protein
MIAVLVLALAQDLDFANDVLPHLTRAGCNAGSCHGSATGQKGFKLSLLGYDSESDWRAITRELRGRRIDLAQPELSLLLRKPLKQLPHGGEKVLAKDSDSYRAILDWIRAGAPYRPAKPVDLVKIEAEAGKVTARYSDGSTRDVTRLALLSSNDDSIAAHDGTIKAAGETAIMVRYGGQVTSFKAGKPYGPAVTPAPRRNAVDPAINDKLARYGLEAAAACDDATFLRRAILDACGRLPTPGEVRSFDGNRDALVDRLVASDEFVDRWATIWSVLWNARTPDFRDWVRSRIGGRYDEMARELLVREPFLYRSIGDPKQLSEFVGQQFLGSRWMCAQCHNHPFEKFTRRDYFQMAAFFARVRVRNDRVELESRGELELDGKPVLPAFGSAADRREDLAKWVVESDAFSRATANRVWAILMGRGLVEPVDDMRASNPATHPELLDFLSGEFKRGFELRRLVALVMKSAAYQRRSGKGDAFYSARAWKPLDADTLSRAVSQATGGGFGADPVMQGETLARTLHLMNSDDVHRLLKSDTVENLYVKTLSRLPTPAERAHWTGTDEDYLKDLFWALLNSKEFGTNH